MRQQLRVIEFHGRADVRKAIANRSSNGAKEHSQGQKTCRAEVKQRRTSWVNRPTNYFSLSSPNEERAGVRSRKIHRLVGRQIQLEAQNKAQASVAEAQKLIDQQFADMQQESERVRQHYETESRKIQEAADALVAKTIKDYEPLRKYEKLRDAEAEAQRQLADALTEATSLRAEAQTLMEQARNAAANERSMAVQKAKDIHEQADARLNQALHDAGRIVAEAEKRAEQIGGDAYTALRDKEMLEQPRAARTSSGLPWAIIFRPDGALGGNILFWQMRLAVFSLKS